MNELYLNKNSYLNFDALNLKSLIVDRLNKGKVFTDQNYQGSNLSAIIDVISLVFGNLLFYLNKTASESMFSEAQLYENMNRIVKLLGYKPVGRIASTLPIRLTSVGNLNAGNYTIPRYSYINAIGTYFSFSEDVSFSKLTNSEVERIVALNDSVLLKQGLYQQYPIYTAIGTENEVLYLSLDEETQIDHYSIDVYVKEKFSTKWVKYQHVNDLFLYRAEENVYEFRFNENKRYEITFGNNVNGRRLNEGDEVLVYYLALDPTDITVGAGSIENAFIIRFNSPEYSEVINNTAGLNSNFLTIENSRKTLISNFYPSTEKKLEETADEMRVNAPQMFRAQNRLATKEDFESYLITKYANILSDVKIMNNNDYLTKYMKYLYNIGLKNPHTETNILFNQVKFSNACNFNNIYFCAVTKTSPTNQAFLNPPQKELIIRDLNNLKTITTEIVPLDPVYIMFDFYTPLPSGTRFNLNDLRFMSLRLYKSRISKKSNAEIVLKVKNVFEKNFKFENTKLGQFIDISQISAEILSLEDIERIDTYNSNTKMSIEGISLAGWNYYYPNNDNRIYTQNIILDDFKYPVFNNLSRIFTKLIIFEQVDTTEPTQF